MKIHTLALLLMACGCTKTVSTNEVGGALKSDATDKTIEKRDESTGRTMFVTLAVTESYGMDETILIGNARGAVERGLPGCSLRGDPKVTVRSRLVSLTLEVPNSTPTTEVLESLRAFDWVERVYLH